MAALLKLDGKCLKRMVAKNSDAAAKLAATSAAVGRALNGVLSEALAAAGSGGSKKGERGGDTVVVTTTEEERSYTMNAYDDDEWKTALKQCKVLYNMRLTAHELPSMSSMRKIVYAVKVDEVFIDPARLPLEKLRRAPEESADLLFTRLMLGHVVAAVGAEGPIGELQRPERRLRRKAAKGSREPAPAA